MSASYLPELHRRLPQDADAEKGLISSFLLAPKEVGAMCAERGVTPEWFYVPAHTEVYGVIFEIFSEGKPIDFITLATKLKDRGKYEAVGGPGFVSSIFMLMPTAANASFYLDTLRDKFIARKMIALCTDYAATGYEEGIEPDTLLARLHADVTSLLCKKAKRVTVRETLKEILMEICTGQPDGSLLKTGMDGVDGRLALYRGDLLMISAPTSCGKSALSFNIAINVAMRGKRVGVYPLEMRQKQSLKRALAQIGGYNAEFVRKVTLTAQNGTEAQKELAAKAQKGIAMASDTIMQMKLHMRDDLTRIEAIMADIRAEQGIEPFDFIVIDYLQLIQTGQKFERRQLEIAFITKHLKALANELDCVICVPSQVNKGGGTREAEDAENDASALIKIHGEVSETTGDIHPGRVEVWKQREGARHVDLPLMFNGLLTRFELQKNHADHPSI